MTGMLMAGKRSTLSLSTATAPSAMTINDIIRIRMGLRRARRVSHIRHLAVDVGREDGDALGVVLVSAPVYGLVPRVTRTGLPLARPSIPAVTTSSSAERP